MKHLLLIASSLLTLVLSGTPREKGPASRTFTDISLVGYWHREPRCWDAERFAPHVSWKAPDGSEQWLFEGFLFLEGDSPVHHKTFVLGGGESADKEAWQYQLDLWLRPGGSVAGLEEACSKTAARIGTPARKRGVIIGIPDAIMFRRFSDKTSATAYWGDNLDFAATEDRLKALRWYIDTARKLFDDLNTRYLELSGFYITSEEIYLPYDIDVNCRYKNWDIIAPALADYCHAAGQGLYWIPYHLGPGYKYWKQLGIDQAWMQPNWYWDLHNEDRHPFRKTMEAIVDYGMGMELEFEYSGVRGEMPDGTLGPDGAGKLVFQSTDVPALQDRIRRYMQEYKDAGLYGKGAIALYSGSNAFTQLATSPVPEDRALYNEICGFITGNREGRAAPDQKQASLLKENLCASVDTKTGNLVFFGRRRDGFNYAGDRGLWRLYYNTPDRKEIEITPKDGIPAVYRVGDTLHIDYRVLAGKAFELHLRIWEENGQARFGATLKNNEPHTIIRELQYPLLGDLQLPAGYQLLTTHTGGQVFENPVWKISNVDVRPLYMTPAQKFRQYDLQYPRNAASNCFAFFGKEDGLYFGSHDPSLQQTWHGLRTYPDEGTIGHTTGDFTHLEAGFYRYPNALYGDSWSNDASVVVPYAGSWRQTAKIYRSWADTWWHHAPVPQWVREMTGWQRIIFKHQYGEYLRTYDDLPGRIAAVGESVGCHAVLAFGWWKEGMDNGYPNYTIDDAQGGEAAWKKAIASFRNSPSSSEKNRLLLYFNGRLIDVESDFYKNGGGKRVSNKDNTGREFTEHYKFTGEGTALGYYDSRTFTIADMSQREWRDQLIQWADRAMSYGADAVFYDQLGVAEEFPNWDLSREYPVQDIFTGRYKAEALQEIRDHIKALNPEFALGTEWLSDCTSQFCDFVHIVEFTALPESFPEWFRYAFPEVIWSDRCVRDDNDVPRRVNNTLLKGLRNDIEVFRCRGLIDETPVYQKHLAAINELRHTWPDLLLEGRFIADEGIRCDHPAVIARAFVNGDRMAVVATLPTPGKQVARIEVPGWHCVQSRSLGDASWHGGRGRFGENGLLVLIFEKD